VDSGSAVLCNMPEDRIQLLEVICLSRKVHVLCIALHPFTAVLRLTCQLPLAVAEW